MRKIAKDRLEGAKQLKSPNVGARIKPRAVVIHYTAGTRAGPAVNTFMNANAKASAHLVIDRDGSITQLVDFTRAAWHAGVSNLTGFGPSCNRYSIGIELVNAGFRSETPSIAESSDWRLIGDKYWHVYTEPQLKALETVLEALWAHYELKALTGHEHIAPKRKTDPGPAFPWPRFGQYPLVLDK
jgi:N-acetylmuramoyl-L-alanine amidase